MPGTFGAVDWAVLATYLLGTSWLADRLAGKKQTIRDFFLGGRKLPWQAVCGSIVASEISGVTFVSVPAIAFAAGGNYTYLMLSLGYIAARFVVAWKFVPAFYRHEIYSPYEFMGRRLGPTVDRVATGIFFLGAFLAQGARLYLAALVLASITNLGIIGSIVVIGAVSVAWTWMGGIASVVWTDVVQFAILFAGGLTALFAAGAVVPGGWSEVLRSGVEADKFRVWNFTLDRTVAYTFWCGLLGMTFQTLASLGTDQMMAQRIFCCRDAADARKAVAWSGVSQILTVLMLTVGVTLYAYFLRVGMTPEEAQAMSQSRDNLLPVFINKAMPAGIRGLLFAAIFSAATATSTLSAMAQTALSAFYLPFAKGRDERHLVFVSRILVLVSAVGLCATASACILIHREYRSILDLALAMAGYTYGALLGMLLLALLPLGRDARGLLWGVPFSLLLVFSLNWNHFAWGRAVAAVGVAITVLSALPALRGEPLKLGWIAATAALVLAAAFARPVADAVGHPAYFKLAYPWHFPIGTAITLGLGVALGRRSVVDSAR